MSDNLYNLLEEALMVILILSMIYIDRRGEK